MLNRQVFAKLVARPVKVTLTSWLTSETHLTSHASIIPWNNNIFNVLDKSKRQGVTQARKRSNNILLSNSSNETNLTVVLENATIDDTRTTSLASKQTIVGSTQYDKIDPLKKYSQLPACIISRNKLLSKDVTNLTTKIILQYWCNLLFKKNGFKQHLLEKQTEIIWGKTLMLRILVSATNIAS